MRLSTGRCSTIERTSRGWPVAMAREEEKKQLHRRIYYIISTLFPGRVSFVLGNKLEMIGNAFDQIKL